MSKPYVGSIKAIIKKCPSLEWATELDEFEEICFHRNNTSVLYIVLSYTLKKIYNNYNYILNCKKHKRVIGVCMWQHININVLYSVSSQGLLVLEYHKLNKDIARLDSIKYKQTVRIS